MEDDAAGGWNFPISFLAPCRLSTGIHVCRKKALTPVTILIRFHFKRIVRISTHKTTVFNAFTTV